MQKIRTILNVALAVSMLILIGCGKPMYVATMGADVYHAPGCKYAEQSLDKYGKIKRLNYHTDLHKDLSGRTPCPKCQP